MADVVIRTTIVCISQYPVSIVLRIFSSCKGLLLYTYLCVCRFENLSFAYIHHSTYFVLIPLTKIKGYKVESEVRVTLSD